MKNKRTSANDKMPTLTLLMGIIVCSGIFGWVYETLFYMYNYDGLLVKPCIPDELTEYTVLRRFRGTEYTIHVKRTGESSMTVDGVKVTGNLIPLSEKSHVTVEVTL